MASYQIAIVVLLAFCLFFFVLYVSASVRCANAVNDLEDKTQEYDRRLKYANQIIDNLNARVAGVQKVLKSAAYTCPECGVESQDQWMQCTRPDCPDGRDH